MYFLVERSSVILFDDVLIVIALSIIGDPTPDLFRLDRDGWNVLPARHTNLFVFRIMCGFANETYM